MRGGRIDAHPGKIDDGTGCLDSAAVSRRAGRGRAENSICNQIVPHRQDRAGVAGAARYVDRAAQRHVARSASNCLRVHAGGQVDHAAYCCAGIGGGEQGGAAVATDHGGIGQRHAEEAVAVEVEGRARHGADHDAPGRRRNQPAVGNAAAEQADEAASRGGDGAGVGHRSTIAQRDALAGHERGIVDPQRRCDKPAPDIDHARLGNLDAIGIDEIDAARRGDRARNGRGGIAGYAVEHRGVGAVLDKVDGIDLADVEAFPGDDRAVAGLRDGQLAEVGRGQRGAAAHHIAARRQGILEDRRGLLRDRRRADRRCESRNAGARQIERAAGQPGGHGRVP